MDAHTKKVKEALESFVPPRTSNWDYREYWVKNSKNTYMIERTLRDFRNGLHPEYQRK